MAWYNNNNQPSLAGGWGPSISQAEVFQPLFSRLVSYKAAHIVQDVPHDRMYDCPSIDLESHGPVHDEVTAHEATSWYKDQQQMVIPPEDVPGQYTMEGGIVGPNSQEIKRVAIDRESVGDVGHPSLPQSNVQNILYPVQSHRHIHKEDLPLVFASNNAPYTTSTFAEPIGQHGYQQTSHYPTYGERLPNSSCDPYSCSFMYPPLPQHGYCVHMAGTSTKPFEAPWSTVNTRRDEHKTCLYEQTTRLVHQIPASDTTYSRHYSHDGASSASNHGPAMSDSSFNSDIDNLMRSWDTVRPTIPSRNDNSLVTEHSDRSLVQASTNMSIPESGLLESVFELDIRESTPLLAPEAYDGSEVGSYEFAPQHNDYLPVPPSQASISEASSPMSVTSASAPETLQCNECETKFTGIHRNGNLGRHRRLKHRMENVMVYHCESAHCGRQFRRQDARLKHYRRRHPHLAPREAVPRGPQRPQN